MTLSELLPTEFVAYGDHAGICAACGKTAQRAHPYSMPDTFTAAYKLYIGDALCPRCFALFKTKSLRTRSWVLTPNNLRHIERKEWLRALLEPPEPPFALYLTLGGKKYGFLSLIHRVSLNRDRYWLATDWHETALYMQRSRLYELAALAQSLRERGVPKTQLLTEPSPTTLAKAVKEGWEGLLQQARAQQGDPHWEVIVYAAD